MVANGTETEKLERAGTEAAESEELEAVVSREELVRLSSSVVETAEEGRPRGAGTGVLDAL